MQQKRAQKRVARVVVVDIIIRPNPKISRKALVPRNPVPLVTMTRKKEKMNL